MKIIDFPPTKGLDPYRLEDLYDGPYPGPCRDSAGRAYGSIWIDLDQVGGADRTAEDCGRVCGTMPRPGDQVGFQYTHNPGYSYNCLCQYEASAVASFAEVAGNRPWVPGGGGSGRPLPYSVLYVDGMVCYAARTGVVPAVSEPSTSPTTERPTSPPTTGPSGSPTAYCPSLSKKKCRKSPICVSAVSGGEDVCVAGTYAPTESPTVELVVSLNYN